MQSPLAGFAGTDCYQLIWPDTLHQANKGDIEHILNLITDHEDEDTIHIIDQRLLDIPHFPGVALPSQGLSTQKMYASQQAAVNRCMPVAILRLPGALMDALRIVIPGNYCNRGCAMCKLAFLQGLEVHPWYC